MPILYSYFRSSSAFRVRIALNLKGIAHELRFINLHPEVSEQKAPEFIEINPQGRVPYFIDGDLALGQSTAILEYLEEKYPQVSLLPNNLQSRAFVRQIVNVIACDMQPLNNIAVLTKLKKEWGADTGKVNQWYADWIHQGFTTVEALLERTGSEIRFCIGDTSTLADVYLIPQVWNALRFNVPLDDYPRIQAIYQYYLSCPAYADALPENQRDNPENISLPAEC